MVFKINIQARIKRHSRILRDTISLWLRDKNYYSYGYNFVIFAVIFLLPIYPALAAFVHDTTIVDFYRWDIDETSILESYVGSDDDGVIAESKDAFLSVNSLLDDTRDLAWVNEILSYTIKKGDTISSIASKFQVSDNSILWANNFSKNTILKPGETIMVPPVSGLIHKVKKWETLLSIAEKYGVSESVIRTQNGLSDGDVVVRDSSLVIPGASKIFDDDVIAKTSEKTTKTSKTSKKTWAKDYTFSKYSQSTVVEKWVVEDGSYTLTKRKPQHTFYWGNCTRYVAQYKNVNWGWNAKDWLKNAANAGHSTGKTAKAWSIVVFYGKWYNPRYGHVWIVTSVKGDTLIVKDMNFRKLNEVTVRKVSASDRSIKWYIYVD